MRLPHALLASGSEFHLLLPKSSQNYQSDSGNNHRSPGEYPPTQFLLQDKQAKNNRDPRRNQRNQHRLGHVHVMDQPVIHEKGYQSTNNRQIEQRDDGHRGPMKVKRISFQWNAKDQQRNKSEENLTGSQNCRIKLLAMCLDQNIGIGNAD